MNNYIEIRDFDKTRNFTVAMCIHTATITSTLGAYTAVPTVIMGHLTQPCKRLSLNSICIAVINASKGVPLQHLFRGASIYP